MQQAKIRRIASGIQSLGFQYSIRASHDPEAEIDDSGPIFVLEWYNMFVSDPPGNYTVLANEIIDCATDNYCDKHARLMFERLDFGQLGTSTTTIDQH
jgi:hypothetical protein